MHGVCWTSNLEVRRGYVSEPCRIADRWGGKSGLRSATRWVRRGCSVGKQSVRQAACRTALDVQAARVRRERRLNELAVEVLLASGEREAATGCSASDCRTGRLLGRGGSKGSCSDLCKLADVPQRARHWRLALSHVPRIAARHSGLCAQALKASLSGPPLLGNSQWLGDGLGEPPNV